MLFRKRPSDRAVASLFHCETAAFRPFRRRLPFGGGHTKVTFGAIETGGFIRRAVPKLRGGGLTAGQICRIEAH